MRILVTGASGRLGSYVMKQLALAEHAVAAWGRPHSDGATTGRYQLVDLADPECVARALRLADPEVVIHLAAISSAEAVRRDPGRGWEINVAGTRRLVDWSAASGRRLVFASTDLVFDGTGSFYREDDPPNPILEYGRTKRAAEVLVGQSSQNLTVRISLLYGAAPRGREGFFDLAIASLSAGVPREFFTDEFRTPLDYASAAGAIVKLAESTVTGLVHLGGPERLSRFDLMRRAAAALGIDPDRVRPGSLTQSPLVEPRPADVSLDSTRIRDLIPELEIPPVETALAHGC